MTPKKKELLGQIRHVLTSMGPLLALRPDLFGLDGAEVTQGWNAIVGFGMAALGFWWSWSSPEKKQ